ncbi:MAG TPA: hypothetical protein VJ725_28040 [Thermoanaerobaculia bacterium]|nr:hypothetical protein [Thermoanaerobaculia bacterium]
MRARDNPFAVSRVLTIRSRLAGVTWNELLDRLAAFEFRAALVGPHGHGKTTLLEDLAPRLEDRGFRLRAATLRAGDRRLTAAQEETLFGDLTGRDLLLVDGAEQLGRLSWLSLRRKSRAAGGLVITSHRAGLLPTLHECRTTPELLEGIVRELLGSEAEGMPELWQRHRGNVRDALRELYDVWADRPVTAPAARTGSP